MCRKEENKARSIFFPHMPSKERGNLYPRTKFKCLSQKATSNETAHETEREVWVFFLNWKHVSGWWSFTLASSGFQKCWISTTTLEKAEVLSLLKIRPSSYGEEPCELPFLSFLCCIPSSIYLGNPSPPPMLKNTILFYRFKKIIVFFSPKKSG